MNLQPNNFTAKTLKMSDSGKGVKHFAAKKALYADLGLHEQSAERIKMRKKS
jgi:hypothetical protein